MSILIDGKEIAREIKNELKIKAAALKEKGVEPCLAVVLVGEDPASQVYVRNKKTACRQVGIKSLSYELPDTTSEDELLALVGKLNDDASVHGILVQLPLPKGINESKVLRAIKPEKDVDGFHPYNIGLMSIGEPGPLPCTPAGIIEMLKRTGITISGKRCVVVGRSNIVGKPAAQLLLKENGTVTVCHSKTADLAKITAEADILVAALGKPRFIKKEMIKGGAVVIDVGIHKLPDGSLCGDADFDGCCGKASHITPVPGGVGPMTIAMLMKNCLELAERPV